MEKVLDENIALSDQNLTKKKGITAFLKDKNKILPLLQYVGISLFILILFAIALACYGVYPFGRATMSSYDMSAQVAPFIEHFYDVFNGKSSLFYSYAIAGGADVFGTLAYCCVSPFTFLFLLFGEGNVYYGTSIVLPLKIVCVGISGLYFIRKKFPKINPIMQATMALSYAFCGYIYVSNTYINWVDLLIYLPFVCIGFGKIVNGESKKTFVVSLALMIYTCFSIACFSLFTIYPIIVLYAIFAQEKQDRKRLLSDCVWALVLSIALSLPILVPALRAFLVSGRKTGLFENINASYSYEALYKKVSYIFTDGLCLFFTIAFFIKYGVKEGKNKFLALAGLILITPVVVDESMNLLNMGSYMSYSLRFGFLTSFYLFYVACCYLQKCEEEKDSQVILHTSRSAKVLFSVIISSLVVFYIVGLVLFNLAIENQTHEFFEKYYKWFASRLAHSEGGLEASVVIFAFIAIIALLGTLFNTKGKISSLFLSIILLVCVCGQSAFYGINTVSGNYMDPVKFEQIGVLTDYVETLEGNGETRVKMNGDYITACMPFTLHTNSYSVFSSVIDSRNFTAPNFFGFGGNGKNSMKSYNGKYIGDCIFGNKYVIVDGLYSRYYLQKVEGYDQILDEHGNLCDVGDYVLYENVNAFPHAFAVKNAKTSYEGGIEADYDSILKMLGGEENGIEWVEDPTVSDLGDGVIKYRTQITGTGNYFMLTDFDDISVIKYSRSSYNEENATLLPQNKELQLGYSSSRSGGISIYFKSVGETALTVEQVTQSCKVFKVSNSAVEKIAEMAKAQTVDFSTKPNEISVKINAEKGDYLFVNYVALPGHTAYVNGEKVQLEDNVLNFMLLPLVEGENDVQIIYKSPYRAFIALGVLLGAVIFGVYILLKKFANKVMVGLSGVLYYLGIGVGAILLLFFFVMPLCVCLFKNVKLLIKTIKGLL